MFHHFFDFRLFLKLPVQWHLFPSLDIFSSPPFLETSSRFLVFNSFPFNCFQNLFLTGLDISLPQYSCLIDTVFYREEASSFLFSWNIESLYTIPWMKLRPRSLLVIFLFCRLTPGVLIPSK